MTKPTFDQEFWEQLWSKTLREHADKVARKPPNAQLLAEAGALAPGRALDAGCGHGADTLWLALQGWQVTAAVVALDPRRWELVVAEERPRAATGTGVDAVIRARRR